MNFRQHFKIGLFIFLLASCLFCTERGYDLDKIRARAEAFDQEITFSWYETDNYGRPSRMAEIYEDYRDLFTDPRLIRFVQQKMHQEQIPREARRLKYLYRYLLEEFAAQKSTELTDQILDVQTQEVLELDRQKVAFRDVAWELSNSPDRKWRRDLYRARGEVIVSKINPLLRQRLEIQRETCAQFGYAHYAEFQDLMNSTDFDQLAQLCENLLYQTQFMYRELLTETARQVLGRPIEEVRVYPRPKFSNRRQIRRYSRLITNIKKVYPFAKLAKEKLAEMDAHITTLRTEHEKHKYIKQMEDELFGEYEDDLKKLTITQGRLLIKLIDRETGDTTYDWVKELKGSLSAFFWQALARIFGSNLKTEFDAAGQDRLINDIILMIDAGMI